MNMNPLTRILLFLMVLSSKTKSYSILNDEEVLSAISQIQDGIHTDYPGAKKQMLFEQLGNYFGGSTPYGSNYGFTYGDDTPYEIEENYYDSEHPEFKPFAVGDWERLDKGFADDFIAFHGSMHSDILGYSHDSSDESNIVHELFDRIHQNTYQHVHDDHESFDGGNYNWFDYHHDHGHNDEDKDMWELLFEEYDYNDDGHLNAEELEDMQHAIDHYKTHYEYEDNGEKYWPLISDHCDNTVYLEQSPIDIKSNEVTRSGRPNYYVHWNVSQRAYDYGIYQWNATYDHHKWKMVSVDNATGDAAVGVMLDVNGTIYLLEQVHFHYGSNNNEGSEHRINGKQYPLEMHWVHYSREFNNFGNAIRRGDELYDRDNGTSFHTLAVVGVFFEIHDNVDYINDAMAELLNVDGIDERIRFENIGDIVPTNVTAGNGAEFIDYYQYEGSLTTPDCYPIVEWIVLKQPVKIGQKQLNKIHRLTDNGFTFRSPQVNTNPVYELDTSNSAGFAVDFSL